MKKYKNKILPRGIRVDNKTGIVYIRFFPKGQEFRETIGPANQPGTIENAKIRLNQLKEKFRLEKLEIKRKPIEATIPEVATIFIEIYAKKELKDQGIAYARHFRFFANLFPKTKYHELSYKHIEKLRKVLDEKGRSYKTANRYQAALSCLFNAIEVAVEKGDIPPIRIPAKNPCRFVEKPSEEKSYRKRVLTFQEYHQIIDAAKKYRFYNLIGAFKGALMTMLRESDLFSLTVDSINQVTNRLGGIQGKTGHPFSIYIYEEMRELISNRPHPESKKLFCEFARRSRWEFLLEKLDIEHIQWRDLRRSGATWLYKRGASIKSISHYLGHRTLKMTEDYIGINSDDEIITGQMMDSIFKIPKDIAQNPHVIIPNKNQPKIDVSKLDIPWLPQYGTREEIAG